MCSVFPTASPLGEERTSPTARVTRARVVALESQTNLAGGSKR